VPQCLIGCDAYVDDQHQQHYNKEANELSFYDVKCLLTCQVASSNFALQPNWTVPYLHDAVYLYLLTVDSMVSAGIDFRNASLFVQNAQYSHFTGIYYAADVRQAPGY
jgi:hypothetical protein